MELLQGFRSLFFYYFDQEPERINRGKYMCGIAGLIHRGKSSKVGHEPLLVSNFAKRKELAAAAEKIVRSAHIFAVSNLKNQAGN